MKKTVIILMCLVLFVSCSTPQSGHMNRNHGIGSALTGFAHLILSPFQIAAGLIEGIASIPYYLSTNIHQINKGLIDAQAEITLDDTYESAYGKRLSSVPEDGSTDEVFRRMKHATKYFQKVLNRYGIIDADRYILTSIDTANSDGYTLFAVVHRPSDTINVIDKYTENTYRTFSKADRLFYEPFEKDIKGKNLDTIIDWAGLPKKHVQTQKAQALLITLAANSVISGKRSPDYWENERRWIAGDYIEIVNQKMNKVKARMEI